MRPKNREILESYLQDIELSVEYLRGNLEETVCSLEQIDAVRDNFFDGARCLIGALKRIHQEELARPSFEEWSRQVDRAMEKMVGVVQADLPDWLSRATFEDGNTPEEAARICLEEAGYGEDWG